MRSVYEAGKSANKQAEAEELSANAFESVEL
jgi:hypothetical protein